MSVDVTGMTSGAFPLPLTSLGDVNNYTDGNYQYEAIDIVVISSEGATE